MNPHDAMVKDHGSWDGRWPLPTRLQWKVVGRLGLQWPCGKDDFEPLAVEAARKEWSWSRMNATKKDAFRQAALEGWSVWQDNGALEILSPEKCWRS